MFTILVYEKEKKINFVEMLRSLSIKKSLLLAENNIFGTISEG